MYILFVISKLFVIEPILLRFSQRTSLKRALTNTIHCSESNITAELIANIISFITSAVYTSAAVSQYHQLRRKWLTFASVSGYVRSPPENRVTSVCSHRFSAHWSIALNAKNKKKGEKNQSS